MRRPPSPARRSPLLCTHTPHNLTHTFLPLPPPPSNRQSVRNKKFREALMGVLTAAGVGGAGCPKSVGALLYTVAGKVRER